MQYPQIKVPATRMAQPIPLA
eukprot:COSAG06_NODE_12396_length_1387_cov_1.048913_2_plen_20_part_01